MCSHLTNLLFSATVLLLFVKVVYTYNYYCEVESCSNPKRHVLCLFPKETIDARCNFLVRSGLMENEKKRLLKLHVELREEHASRMKTRTRRIKFPQLFWDHDLAMMAQRWADQCNPENDECRSVDEYAYVAKQNVGHYVLKQHPPHLRRSVVFDHKTAVKDWALSPLNPANPAVSKYHAVNRVGCGLTIRSECDWKASYPAGSGYCLNFYHVYIVCNYSIFNMRLRV